MKSFSTVFPFFVSSIFAFSLFGCDVNGGGWIPSPSDRQDKANFGFNFHCDLETDELDGQLEWHDHASGVHFHAEADTQPYDCVDEPSIAGAYYGDYEPQSKKLGEGGGFMVYVTDNGASGLDETDEIQIQLYGGVYDGYYASGTLQGGNLSFKKP